MVAETQLGFQILRQSFATHNQLEGKTRLARYKLATLTALQSLIPHQRLHSACVAMFVSFLPLSPSMLLIRTRYIRIN